MKIVKYNSNWADEMDLDGFCIMTEEEYDAFAIAVAACKGFTFYVGTNEFVEYESASQLRDDLKVSDISSLAAMTIEQTLGKQYGYFPYDNIMNCYNDETN